MPCPFIITSVSCLAANYANKAADDADDTDLVKHQRYPCSKTCQFLQLTVAIAQLFGRQAQVTQQRQLKVR